MGMKIFESSGTFSPSDYGLIAGDVVDVICVGGGGSGGTNATNGGASVDGSASSFGAITSANGIVMGKGEVPTESWTVGCGAGGYLPGVPFYGGNGGNPIGMAGTSKEPVSPYCNPGGPGNKGATGGYITQGTSDTTIFAPGGNGYGAGGGGYRTGVSGTPYPGGDAGKIVFGSVVLSNTSAISVTVGAGGVNAGNSSLHGASGVVIVFW